jgi:ribosomal protein S17E
MANVILRTAEKLIQERPALWGLDFEKNKRNLDEMDITNSKVLRNKIAGAITRKVKASKKEEAQ